METDKGNTVLWCQGHRHFNHHACPRESYKREGLIGTFKRFDADNEEVQLLAVDPELRLPS